MSSHRTTARGIVLLLIAVVGMPAGAAAASRATPPKRLVFPVVGKAEYTNDFGQARYSGTHEGIDIMSVRRAPAVAAEAGTIRFHATSRAAGCMLYLEGRSKTEYLYVHLNNDLTKANDNRGRCVPGVAYAKGLKNGATVYGGQHIAFVGDSGDANGIAPHLHFEMHPGGGGPINPYPHLNRATRLLFSAPLGSLFTLALRGTLVSVPDGALELKLTQVRSYPGSLLIPQVGRSIFLTVPETARIETAAAGVVATTLRRLQLGRPLLVWTAPAFATFPAQLGEPGELAVDRVVLS
jgi:hypothetical protein